MSVYPSESTIKYDALFREEIPDVQRRSELMACSSQAIMSSLLSATLVGKTHEAASKFAELFNDREELSAEVQDTVNILVGELNTAKENMLLPTHRYIDAFERLVILMAIAHNPHH